MRFKGAPEYEEFWSFLEDETSRGLAVVVAAYFDEKLGSMLGKPKASFAVRINDALANNLITQNECDDLHVMRSLRNSFAHKLRAKDFDPAMQQEIDGLKTWQIAVGELPTYEELFPTARERLLYVAATLAVRLIHRAIRNDPLPEPGFLDPIAWPPVSDR
jgi:hypothetical protein